MTTDSPLFRRLAAAADDEATARAAAPLLAFDLYRRVYARRAFDERLDRASLRTVLDRLPQDATSLTDAEVALVTILQALPAWGSGRAHDVAVAATYTAWIEFARRIGDAGELPVLLYVLAEIGADAEMLGAFGLAARARHYEGAARCRVADWDGARFLFRRSRQLARAAGSRVLYFRSRIGEANILWLRGNLPAAEAALDRIIATTRRVVPEVTPRALLMRGAVAYHRGHLDAAIGFTEAALFESDDPALRARIVAELAGLLSESRDPEVRASGRRALEHVALHSADRSTRHHMAVTLLECAVADRASADFERWCDVLATARLAPRQAVMYHLARARGWRIFGRSADVERDLDAALAIAERHELGQLVVQIEAERTRTGADQPAPSARAPRVNEPVPACGVGLDVGAVASRLDALLATAPAL